MDVQEVMKQARVAAPCPVKWEEMVGDQKMRFCSQCEQNVFKAAALTDEEVLRNPSQHVRLSCAFSMFCKAKPRARVARKRVRACSWNQTVVWCSWAPSICEPGMPKSGQNSTRGRRHT